MRISIFSSPVKFNIPYDQSKHQERPENNESKQRYPNVFSLLFVMNPIRINDGKIQQLYRSFVYFVLTVKRMTTTDVMAIPCAILRNPFIRI
ncbi:MAG: hypothetical protein RIT43_1138 [Bacteroidota bacterium]